MHFYVVEIFSSFFPAVFSSDVDIVLKHNILVQTHAIVFIGLDAAEPDMAYSRR